MTDKKKNILGTALRLFANEGYIATSTNKIAKEAGVSEGLIFRHFKNKDGLLSAIIKEGEDMAKSTFADIVFEPTPQEVIRKTLELSRDIAKNKKLADFWKLQYKIKWEVEHYGEQKMEPLKLALANAFSKLGYKSPELEARLLLVNMDGLATQFFLQENFDLDTYVDFMQDKYNT